MAVSNSEDKLTKIQLKAMDIGLPLIGFYSCVQDMRKPNPPENLATSMEELERGL